MATPNPDSIFHGGDWHNWNDFPPDREGEGYSDDVLIDLNGKRKHFLVGWYDYDDKQWRFHAEDTSYFEEEHMKWTYLPLVYYDPPLKERFTDED